MTGAAVSWPAAGAALLLVVLALALSWWFGLGIERQVVVASVRAALQLLAVGLVFAAAFSSRAALAWAWVWVVGMVVVATVVVGRRTDCPIPGLRWWAAVAVTVSAGVSIAVVFGFGVIDYQPVSLVVVVGITIGNAVPSAVLGAKQGVSACRQRRGELEALLALGLDGRQVVRFLAPPVASVGILPQVERTKVVGLIALPGAMTGLLLAGVEPVEAVVVQLLVMYLILGTATACVVILVAVVVRAAVDADLRAAEWTATASG